MVKSKSKKIKMPITVKDQSKDEILSEIEQALINEGHLFKCTKCLVIKTPDNIAIGTANPNIPVICFECINTIFN